VNLRGWASLPRRAVTGLEIPLIVVSSWLPWRPPHCIKQDTAEAESAPQSLALHDYIQVKLGVTAGITATLSMGAVKVWIDNAAGYDGLYASYKSRTKNKPVQK